MNIHVFGIVTNLIASVVLFGVGAMELNNLTTSVPATLCFIAGVGGIIKIVRERSQ